MTVMITHLQSLATTCEAVLQGRCNTGPASLPVTLNFTRTYTQGSCVIVASDSVVRTTASLWVDRLHVVLVDEPPQEGSRLQLCNGGFSVCEVEPEPSADAVLFKVTGGYARLWVTNTVFQVLHPVLHLPDC